MSSPDPPAKTHHEQSELSFAQAAGLLLIGVMGIGFAPILARMAGWYEVDPTASAFWRFTLALPFLIGASWFQQHRGDTRPDDSPRSLREIAAVAVPGVFLACDMACWHVSFLYTPVANATVIANLATLLVAFIGWAVLRERLTWLYPAGVAAALVGVAILVDVRLDTRSTPFGNGMALAAAVCYAGYQIAAKLARRRFTARTILTYASIAGSLLLLPVPMLLGHRYLPNEAIGWLPLLGLAIIPHLLGQGLIATSLRHLPVSIASPLLLAQPIFVGLFGYLILGEAVGWTQVAGGVLVLVGLGIAIRGRG
ncbi:DMT family transporter [Stratiformator vulcanicus]|uniref:4-amino-4-deoxy-L-arabinose-phosphoundecaprenol flippase subunit ArnE n=1 Tax=Stratiformator vulcanicus TaxID=2527980 RepID=A0A517QXA5_9PLAN|nr:DMT family transporter [Stratiformator vulcanicus]QDT36292.1 4-amino-4-deoxy-L-arabinose-phosphoundecaprenol flippase subunit ArnE [Stratiformator vulcanicus]